jgi:ribosomal RNA-processing protein 12
VVQGRGDVKKSGRPDPYAYIPLSHKSLNKRKQAKAKGQFNTVVKAAK